jgi:hypothetical protein
MTGAEAERTPARSGRLEQLGDSNPGVDQNDVSGFRIDQADVNTFDPAVYIRPGHALVE